MTTDNWCDNCKDYKWLEKNHVCPPEFQVVLENGHVGYICAYTHEIAAARYMEYLDALEGASEQSDSNILQVSASKGHIPNGKPVKVLVNRVTVYQYHAQVCEIINE